MASIVLTIKSNEISLLDIQNSATDAGLSFYIINSDKIDVFASNIIKLNTWHLQFNNIHGKYYSSEYSLIKIQPCVKTLDTANFSHLSNLISVRSTTSYFTMKEMCSIYNIPPPNIATKVVIGVVSFGGGLYGSINTTGVLINGIATAGGVLTNSHIHAYWAGLNIFPPFQPKIIVIPVNGAINVPDYNDGGLTNANTINVETIGVTCPSPHLTIILYIAKHTSNFYDIFSYILTKKITVNGAKYNPTIITCPWSIPEIYVGPNEITNMKNLLLTATNNGINIFTACYMDSKRSYVDFPSSCPYVTAVGGTSLICPNKIYDKYTVETAWSSGGGISIVYDKPYYQSTFTKASGRTIPDIASNADINTGILFGILDPPIYVPFGGTGIAASFMAGFCAVIYFKGFLNPLLYDIYNKFNHISFHDIISGTNGKYFARSGYDLCTGLGTINGSNIVSKMSSVMRIATGISVTPSIITLNIGRSVTVDVTITPLNASYKGFTSQSNNSKIATFSNGSIIANSTKRGTAIITLTTADGSKKNTIIIVTVVVPKQKMIEKFIAKNTTVSSINLNPKITISKGSKYILNPTITPEKIDNSELIWTTANSSIVTVDSTGTIKAIKSGTTVIIVKSVNGITAKCDIIVP